MPLLLVVLIVLTVLRSVVLVTVASAVLAFVVLVLVPSSRMTGLLHATSVVRVIIKKNIFIVGYSLTLTVLVLMFVIETSTIIVVRK